MIIKNLFGADLIVGNGLEITPSFAYKLSGALVKVFKRKNISFVIGYDTRQQSRALAHSLVEGLLKLGAKVFFVDKTTSGGISFAVKHYKATAGVLVTASEKLFIYNGFKIFNGNGFKISDEQMSAVKYSVLHDTYEYNNTCAEMFFETDFNEIYAKYLLSFVEKKNNFVIDVAHGSGAVVAQYLSRHIDITVENSAFNGFDINYDCGINNLNAKQGKWYIKIDGDGDKIVAISPNGKVLKGDAITTLFSLYYNEPCVTNLLTNNSYFDLLDKHNIKYELTGLGERRLVDTMLKKGYNLCGERNGSVIMFNTKTSDAFITAIKLANMFNDEVCDKVLSLHLIPHKDLKYSLNYEKIHNNQFEIMVAESERLLENCGKIIVRINHVEQIINVYIESLDLLKMEQVKNKFDKYLSI